MMGRPPSGTRIPSILAESDAPAVDDLESLVYLGEAHEKKLEYSCDYN
jgi:hypothetical protein